MGERRNQEKPKSHPYFNQSYLSEKSDKKCIKGIGLTIPDSLFVENRMTNSKEFEMK